MRKSILVLATAFTLTAFFTSCRDTKKANDDMEQGNDGPEEIKEQIMMRH